jgi:hypothetical protein
MLPDELSGEESGTLAARSHAAPEPAAGPHARPRPWLMATSCPAAGAGPRYIAEGLSLCETRAGCRYARI